MLFESLTWLGHSGFLIRAGRAHVYIDPYRVPDGAPAADVILVTHHHYDHFSPQDVERLSGDRTLVVAPPAVAERVRGRVVSLAPGEGIDDPLDLRAIAAYNTSKRGPDGKLFHPREAGGVGYVLNVRGERLYHSGDTDVIPEMDEVAGVDVALLAVSGVYVMTAAEAAEAARRIAPRVAVPMHWGEHIGTREDADAFARSAPVEVRILDRANGPDA
jgi:L-ascorbate metabolism protein UlaG (beta-lactamase superfamily)